MAIKKSGARKTQKRVAKKVGVSRKKVSKKIVKTGRAPGKRVTKTGVKSHLGQKSYKIRVGDRCPHFEGTATSGRSLSNRDFTGRPLVLYFYPKDNTPGCTLEGNDFRRLFSQFESVGCAVIGVSKDSVKSHENFKRKCGFPFELLSDESGSVCRAFDVIQMKSLYGRKFEGIERTTFVIDGSGHLRAEWRKVKVAGHADEVLAFVKSMK